MITFLIRRLLLAVVTMWLISVLSFAIIQLPPGDFVDAYIAQMASSGSSVSAEEAAAMRQLYGLGQPFYIQYGKWIVRIVRGDFGEWMEPAGPRGDGRPDVAAPAPFLIGADDHRGTGPADRHLLGGPAVFDRRL